MTCSCLCFALSWVKQRHLERRGFRCGLLALLAFTLGAVLYLYVAKVGVPIRSNETCEAFPLSSLIRSESLFYFMLPEPQEQAISLRPLFKWQEPAGRMLLASDGDHPLKRRSIHIRAEVKTLIVGKSRQTFHFCRVNMLLPLRLVGKSAPKRKPRASTAQGPHLQLLAAPSLKIAPCSRASRAQARRKHRASRPQRSKAMGHV